jgi:hypothetical protein
MSQRLLKGFISGRSGLPLAKLAAFVAFAGPPDLLTRYAGRASTLEVAPLQSYSL